MKKLTMCYLEKDYLIIGLFVYVVACAGFSLPVFSVSCRAPQFDSPGHYIHEQSQDSLTFALGDNVLKGIGIHPSWVLSPRHPNTHRSMPNTKKKEKKRK